MKAVQRILFSKFLKILLVRIKLKTFTELPNINANINPVPSKFHLRNYYFFKVDPSFESSCLFVVENLKKTSQVRNQLNISKKIP